jgi:hypothetical protein
MATSVGPDDASSASKPQLSAPASTVNVSLLSSLIRSLSRIQTDREQDQREQDQEEKTKTTACLAQLKSGNPPQTDWDKGLTKV